MWSGAFALGGQWSRIGVLDFGVLDSGAWTPLNIIRAGPRRIQDTDEFEQPLSQKLLFLVSWIFLAVSWKMFFAHHSQAK